MRFGASETDLNSPVTLTDRPKAVLSLRSHSFMLGAVKFFNVSNVLILTRLYVQFM